MIARDNFFNLSGLAYGSTPWNVGTNPGYILGSAGTNFSTTQYGYDADGRPNQQVAPSGDITRIVHDALGRVLSTWQGSDDFLATDSDPSGGEMGQELGNDMEEMTSNVYDNGGTGDGNLTQQTTYVGAGETARVVDNY